MTVTTTHFEIVLFRDGRFIGQPLPCPTLRAAREEADDMVRGHLDSAGNRGPAREPVFELEALSADGLGKLPRELVEELRDATLSGNKKLLDKLILQVSETDHAEFARSLQALADKYEYDALTRLLEEACSR